MSGDEYKAAIRALGLSVQEAGRWLGVSPRTAQNYAKHGPAPTAELAIIGACKFGLWCELRISEQKPGRARTGG